MKQTELQSTEQKLIAIINQLMLIVVVLLVSIISIVILFSQPPTEKNKQNASLSDTGSTLESKEKFWRPVDITLATSEEKKAQLAYGKELIAHTSKYLGPQGTVMPISNGMNCQNCHLEAGTKIFGNNYGSVASIYPKFRARSGTVENIFKRVNDCIERSLNGKALDTGSKEMLAIAQYITYIGGNVEKGQKAKGSGLKDLTYLSRAADAQKGKTVYVAKCQSCHQPDGGGLLMADKSEYSYPPLWGNHSYNDGAGLYRLSNFAKYVKYNMPQGVVHDSPQLTDEEAWDVAAFVNSQPRPHLEVPKDWPDIAKKPVDHPFGPFADSFSALQHKYGPFQPIVDAQKKKEAAKKSSNAAATVKSK